MKKETYWEQWRKENWFWVLVYGLIFVYFMARFYGQASGSDLDQWSNFKQAVALPLVFLLAAVFINLFSNRIVLPPIEEAQEPEKAERLERINRSQSLQRRNWMIFAYGFMLFSLLVPIYTFGPGWDKVDGSSDIKNKLSETDKAQKELSRTKNDAIHPMAIFIGCSLGDAKNELSCFPSAQPAETKNQPDIHVPAAAQEQAGSQQSTESAAKPEVARGAWVLNLGGHVVNASKCRDWKEDADQVCQVRGGLLIPLYVIILALMGGSISLTRRLPEYQKCANSQYVSTGKEKKLTQHEFREYLIFQIIQFISAPLIAILAYFLIDPGTAAASVALAFTSGFASESVLLMVRAAAMKVSPVSTSPKDGTISGVVQLTDVRGRISFAENAEVLLTASSQVRALTDKAGFYVLHNVPVGEHGVKVSLTDYESATGSVKIERAQELVKQHWNLKKKT